MYQYQHQSLAATRSYLCAYGNYADQPFLHLLDRETGALFNIDEKISSHNWQNTHFFSSNNELHIALQDFDRTKGVPIQVVNDFGLGTIRDESIPLFTLGGTRIYGYSRYSNSLFAMMFPSGDLGDFVFHYGLDGRRWRGGGKIPHRRPPPIYSQELPTEEAPLIIKANQHGEVAVLIKGWVDPYGDGERPPMYARVEIFSEGDRALTHEETIYIAETERYHFPVALAVDFDGSFLVLTDSYDYTEPDRCTVFRCARLDRSAWQLEEMNSYSNPDHQFSVLDLFVAGGHIFVAGVTDRGVRKSDPTFPRVSWERYPFVHSFRRADGEDTNLASTNLHANANEEWAIARVYVDTSFVYIHGFIHGNPSFKRFKHDGTPAPF